MCPFFFNHAVLNALFSVLTHDAELHEEAPDGLRADLALVPAGVSLVGVLDLQHPLVRLRAVQRLVAQIGRVCVPAHGQDVQVVVPDPGDLQQCEQEKG